MVKRTLAINFIITAMLGLATGFFMDLLASTSSTSYGLMAIGSAIGCVLNILCGSDKQKKNEDKKE